MVRLEGILRGIRTFCAFSLLAAIPTCAFYPYRDYTDEMSQPQIEQRINARMTIYNIMTYGGLAGMLLTQIAIHKIRKDRHTPSE